MNADERVFCKEEILANALDVDDLARYFECGKNIAYRIIGQCPFTFKCKNKRMVLEKGISMYIERQCGHEVFDFGEDERMYIHEAYGDFLTAKDVSYILGISINKVYDLCSTHKINAVQLGSRWLIPACLLDYAIECGVEINKGGRPK